jgi:integrase
MAGKSKKLRIPSYRKHKPTGQAVVTIGERDIYLGKHGSAASHQEYNRLIAEYAGAGGAPLTSNGNHDRTIAELLAAFLKFAKAYHTHGEQVTFASSMKPLKELYSRTKVTDFGPLSLKAVRQKMVESGLARSTVNRYVNRVRHIFKWGCENELVPSNVLLALKAVAGLRYGRSEAREAEPVKPVPEAFVDAVLPHVAPAVAAMIELQRFAGMRSGEVVIMRGREINTSGKVWLYSPSAHKTAHRGHERKIYLGPKAQEIVRPFLKTDLDAYLFSPVDSVSSMNNERHANRKTPLSYGNSPGTNRAKKPKRKPGNVYSVASYRRAIERGITKENKLRRKEAKRDGIPADQVALVPHWHPHQLRHNAATALRREYGIEVARIILGHRSAAITEVYAEVDHTKALDVMSLIG